MHKSSKEGVPSPWTQRKVDLEGARMRVLVVDDNQNAAEALAVYFSLERMECRTAFGGIQAITIATLWCPHVIVMDISMPECNGFEAALVLRGDSRTSDVAIVAFTALDETEVRRHLTDHEFDAYYQKGQPPGDLAALLLTMAR
jgi:two-component system, OmpR family, response regulator